MVSGGGSTGKNSGKGESYVHVQSQPAATWVVAHHLGFQPGGIMLRNDAGEAMRATVASNTANQTVITFSEPVSGTATLS